MEDLLRLIAELSVGIAGFTAVFSVLDPARGQDTRDAALQLIRVKQMLLGGVTTALACVVALGLIASPLDRTTVWRIAGGAPAITILSFFVFINAEARRENIFTAPQFSRTHAAVVYVLVLGSVMLLALTVATAGDPVAPGLFTSGVIVMLSVSAIQFARAAISQFAGAGSKSRST